MRKKALALLVLLMGFLFFIRRERAAIEISPIRRTPVPADTHAEEAMLKQLDEPATPTRFLKLPPATKNPVPEMKRPDAVLQPPAPTDARAINRRKRDPLPLGVVLTDNVKIYAASTGEKVAYDMSTGDFVKVYADSTPARVHIHPGVDIYLAVIAKEFETSGNRFPDQDGWVDRRQLNVFNPDEAKTFTQTIEPMTLGKDPNFSTVAFYERALKNPDPVVHRVIAPRLMSILSGHEDYSSAWGRLLRDPDIKVRSVTLATLNERGISQSPSIMMTSFRAWRN